MAARKSNLNDLIKEYLTLQDEQKSLDVSNKLEKAENRCITDRIAQLGTILQLKYNLNISELSWDDLNVKIEKLDGYHKVRWQNKIFEFNNAQAFVVELLDKNGSMHESKVREIIGTSETHLGGVFRHGEAKERHPAWNYMIIKDNKRNGCWKIA